MIAQVLENSQIKVLEGMKQITISSDLSISSIDSDLKLILSGLESTTVTLSAATFIGCEILVVNMSDEKHTISYNNENVILVEPNSVIRLVYTNKWIPETNMIPTDSPSNSTINGSMWIQTT